MAFEGPDDAEGFEQRIDRVHHKQEEACGRQKRENDRAEPPPRGRAVDGRGLDERAGDGVQPGEEEQEVIRDLFP